MIFLYKSPSLALFFIIVHGVIENVKPKPWSLTLSYYYGQSITMTYFTLWISCSCFYFSLYPPSHYLPSSNYCHCLLRLLQYTSKWSPFIYFNPFSRPQVECYLQKPTLSMSFLCLKLLNHLPVVFGIMNKILYPVYQACMIWPCSYLLPHPVALCSSHSPLYFFLSFCLLIPLLTILSPTSFSPS